MPIVYIALILALVQPAFAIWRTEMAQEFTPQERDWFKQQLVPGGGSKGSRCCDESDGTFAQEDIRDGHYWTRYHYRYYSGVGVAREGDTDWVPVPDRAVIHEPNRHGAPAVWYFFAGGTEPQIRCYAPGAGL
jgi:hypothetical protein